jgi:hypothetical protein
MKHVNWPSNKTDTSIVSAATKDKADEGGGEDESVE